MTMLYGCRANMYTFCIDCVLGIECKAIPDAGFYPLLVRSFRRPNVTLNLYQHAERKQLTSASRNAMGMPPPCR